MFEPIREDLREVEREFAHHVQSQVQLIPTMGTYIQNSGGKRIRPAVLLMAARMAGYQGEQAILYASVVEFIHTATLVHDDIIDESELRRGRQAVHSRWGNDITVLLGDFLYIKSMSLALTQDRLDLIRLLCDVTLRMIEGELYQLTKNGVVDLTEDEHFDILRRKTAYLFGGCAKIGGMLGDTTPQQSTASTSAWRFRSSTTSSISPGRRTCSGSRLAATCAKGRSRSRSFTCCTAATHGPRRSCAPSSTRATSPPKTGAT
jgi:octaprenyl-diphosphate synthase